MNLSEVDTEYALSYLSTSFAHTDQAAFSTGSLPIIVAPTPTFFNRPLEFPNSGSYSRLGAKLAAEATGGAAF